MATAYIPIYNDIVNETLVLGTSNPGSFALPDLKKGGLVPIRYWPLRPTNQRSSPFFSLLDIAGLSLRIQIGANDTILAYQDTWTKQQQPDELGQYNYFYADLDLNTTELNAAIGASAYYQTYFEVQLNDNGWRSVYLAPLRMLQYVRDPSGAADLPDPADAYLTKAQASGQYVQFVMGAGESIIWKSQDGTKTTEQYLDNDGTMHYDPLT